MCTSSTSVSSQFSTQVAEQKLTVKPEGLARVFFIRVVRLYHVISFLRMSTYGSISADYSQLAL